MARVQRIAVVVGARPNFIKAAPVMREFLNRPEHFEPILIHTGQHYDASMSDIFFRDLGIPEPHFHLGCSGANHAQTVAMVTRRILEVMSTERFDALLVFGDVSSTLGATLAASKSGVRVVHVESGLRSHDPRMPEEINRVLTDHLSDILFTSEPVAHDNLTKEGIDPSRIHHVGNVMIDSLAHSLPRIEATNALGMLGVEPKSYILATIHRQETVDDPKLLERVFKALQDVATQKPVILPLHPRTRARLVEFGRADLLDGLRIIEPLGYLEFNNLMRSAYAVVTDSGGIQEESSWMDVPCLTLRDNTERPVTVSHGTNTMVTVADENLSQVLLTALKAPKRLKEQIPLWDGQTAKRIADILIETDPNKNPS